MSITKEFFFKKLYHVVILTKISSVVFIQTMQFVKKQHNIILKALILYNFGRPFIGHHSIHLVCLNHVPERSRICIFFFRNTSIVHLLSSNYLPLECKRGGGLRNLTNSCLLILQMLHTKFCQYLAQFLLKRLC